MFNLAETPPAYVLPYAPHHISLSVKNLKVSIEFYAVFGFSPVANYTDTNLGIAICHLTLQDLILELICLNQSVPYSASGQTIFDDLSVRGIKHFALKVDDLETTICNLAAQGIQLACGPCSGLTGIKYVFVKDPDGIYLEILEDRRQEFSGSLTKQPEPL